MVIGGAPTSNTTASAQHTMPLVETLGLWNTAHLVPLERRAAAPSRVTAVDGAVTTLLRGLRLRIEAKHGFHGRLLVTCANHHHSEPRHRENHPQPHRVVESHATMFV